MNRRGAVAVVALGAIGVAGLSPAFAAPSPGKGKPMKGSFSFTDTTPDPTPNVSDDTATHCNGRLPSAPTDVNSHAIKITRKGMLAVAAHVVGDWALQIRDAKGRVLTGDDVNPPQSEGALLTITKRGTYQLVLCNLEGAPTATADYTFTPKK